LFVSECKFNFLVFNEELLNATTWLTLPKGLIAWCKKINLVYT
jgi:hypothetical protein